MVEVMKIIVTSFKKSHAHCHTQCPQLCSIPPSTHPCARDSWTLTSKSGLVSCGVTAPFSYKGESWTTKKAEHHRTDAFELWYWRRLLRVPLIVKRSNQSILKEINPEYSLAGVMLKLKLQYFGHLMQRADSLEKTLMLGKIEGRRRRGQQRMRWLDHRLNAQKFEQTPGDSEQQGS